MTIKRQKTSKKNPQNDHKLLKNDTNWSKVCTKWWKKDGKLLQIGEIGGTNWETPYLYFKPPDWNTKCHFSTGCGHVFLFVVVFSLFGVVFHLFMTILCAFFVIMCSFWSFFKMILTTFRSFFCLFVVALQLFAILLCLFWSCIFCGHVLKVCGTF